MAVLSVRPVVQASPDAAVTANLVDALHVSLARLWQNITLVHIWNREQSTDEDIPASRASV